MNFGKRTLKADALRIVARALDAGVDWFDTANAYNDGESERILGEAIRGRPAFVATKVGAARRGGHSEGLSRERILAACDESLARLGVEAIDLYYLHLPDASVAIEESLAAMASLREAGKIRDWGVSNYASWQILEMRSLAAAVGLPPPAVAQQLFNALVRQLDIEYFKFTRRYPVHTTVYNPLAGGLLAGAHRLEASPPPGSRFDGNALYRRRYWHRALFEAVEALRAVADAEGTSLVELAYALVMRHPGVDSVLVGPGSVAHLDAALQARERRLSAEATRKCLEIAQELVGTDASYAR
jgi:aryl-alcohol dehydrogenase-like predicted oxidoreductase